MNLTDEGTGRGTDAINQMLKEIQQDNGENYTQIAKEMDAGFAKPALSILIHSNAGNVLHEKIIDNVNQKGRPLLMVITDKGYLFCNMHGAQKPQLKEDMVGFNQYMVDNNKIFLQEKVKEFWDENEKPEIKNVCIMGDFNDRYDGIKNFTLSLNKDFEVIYGNESPYSCCHNWDSSAVEERRQYFEGTDNKYRYGKDPTIEEYPQAFGTDGIMNLKTEIPDNDVLVGNYLYKGDKIFYTKPGKLSIWNPELDKVSNKSDHELVYFETDENATSTESPSESSDILNAILPETETETENKPASGGKRKTKKSKKTRKPKRSNKRRSRKQKSHRKYRK